MDDDRTCIECNDESIALSTEMARYTDSKRVRDLLEGFCGVEPFDYYRLILSSETDDILQSLGNSRTLTPETAKLLSEFTRIACDVDFTTERLAYRLYETLDDMCLN